MAKRVFTGRQPTVFMTGSVGRVEPGAEFEVPDEFAESFDARRDVAVTGRDYEAGTKAGRRKARANQDGGDGDPAGPDDNGEQEAGE